MSRMFYTKNRIITYLCYFFTIIIAFSCLLVAISLANSVGAIIISGSDHFSFANDVSNMTAALTNTSVGYGISSSNIYSGNNQSFANFQSAINQMNNSGISELHIYVSTHGNKGILKFGDSVVSKAEFISAINQSSASTKHVVLDSCYSGSFYDDLSCVVGQNGTVITSADENHESRYFFSSFFTSTFSNYMQDADSDSNQDGKVTYDEALSRLKTEGGWLPNMGHPKSANIPTLSEWKQIFLTLLMLSLVMGFMQNRFPAFGLSNGSTMLRFNGANLLVFNRHVYYSVLRWVGFVVALGLAGATVIFGHVSMLDIAGTLFCAPLVAYILHLVISFIHDYKGISG